MAEGFSGRSKRDASRLFRGGGRVGLKQTEELKAQGCNRLKGVGWMQIKAKMNAKNGDDGRLSGGLRAKSQCELQLKSGRI